MQEQISKWHTQNQNLIPSIFFHVVCKRKKKKEKLKYVSNIFLNLQNIKFKTSTCYCFKIFTVNIFTVIYLSIQILKRLHSYSLEVLKWIVHKSVSILTFVIFTAAAELSNIFAKVWESYPNDSKQTHMTKN